MDKINPLLYITDTDPVPEEVLDASGWFETEYMTATAVRVDTPTSSEITGGYIEWFMAQGWVQYDADYNVRSVDGTTISYNITYYLKRRKLQAERVLGDMIQEFTDAYNEGREINDRRYDEIVTLYDKMLDKSEDEITTLDSTVSSYDTLITAVLNNLPTDFTAHETDVGTLLDDWGDSRRDEIATQFDNELAKAKQALVTRGMYNTTVWTSVSAGIETQRAKALTDLEDKIVERKLVSKDRLHTIRVDMRKNMIDAYHRMLGVKHDHSLKTLDFRNAILGAMLNFMERRSDEYPGLDSLADIAAKLGYSEGAAVVAPS